MLIIPYLLYVALPDPGDYLIFTEMNNKTEIVPSDMMMLVYSEEVGERYICWREQTDFLKQFIRY